MTADQVRASLDAWEAAYVVDPDPWADTVESVA